MQKTVCFTTLGCKVNQYDSQAMLEQFEQHGYTVAPAGAPAGVYVVNTCTVTGTGDKKSLQPIRRCRRRNPGAELVVTGCLAQRMGEALRETGARLILGTQYRARVVELLEQAVGWSLRTLTGLVVGFHLIQAMILPYADAAGQAGMKRLMEMIPGLGQGAGAMAQMVLGSGVLIKNTMGAAAVVVLAVISVVPVMKLTVLMIMYQCVAAVMQPVCDKRVVSCVSGVSKGHKLLLQIVLYSMFLFMVAIAITCATTNVNYFAS